MDWITKMNTAVNYIEKNLAGEINTREAGRLAGCSFYHFQRVFSYMAGTTLAEYIRRRRLTLAAFDLQRQTEKVIDIALKYGYDSPTSFTRAFKALHGMSPSEAKKSGKTFVAHPPISFQITIQGVKAMNYSIEKKGAFRVVGAKIKTTMENDEALAAIPGFWGELVQSGTFGSIVGQMNREPAGVFGISISDNEDEKEYEYMVAVSSDKPVDGELAEYQIPAATWAVFEAVGPMPSSVQDMQRRIFTEWLPTSGYELDNGPDIEVYSDGDQQAADYKSWVWVPIVEKKTL